MEPQRHKEHKEGVGRFQDEFVCGGAAATHKFIPPISNPKIGATGEGKKTVELVSAIEYGEPKTAGALGLIPCRGLTASLLALAQVILLVRSQAPERSETLAEPLTRVSSFHLTLFSRRW